MQFSPLIGVTAFAFGEMLIIFAWSRSGTAIDPVTNIFRRRYGHHSRSILITGVAMALSGALLLFGNWFS